MKHRPVNTLDGGCHLLPVDPRKEIQNHPVNKRPSPRVHPFDFPDRETETGRVCF